MLCNGCKKEYKDVVRDLANRIYCKPCFLRLIERKVKKELRGINHQKIALLKSDSASFFVLKSILTVPYVVIENLDNYIVYDTVILPFTCEDEDELFLDQIFSGKFPRKLGNYTLKKTNFLKPLLNVSLSECKTYCDLVGIKVKVDDTSSKISRIFLDRMSEKNKSLKQSLSRFVQKFSKL
ncbi:hypothetical protein JXM83_00420 [Candidatus Woesearchaeota archaeon]|nr:hypothetical protein [Candidatus Woesearchaeota archaeon]